MKIVVKCGKSLGMFIMISLIFSLWDMLFGSFNGVCDLEFDCKYVCINILKLMKSMYIFIYYCIFVVV